MSKKKNVAPFPQLDTYFDDNEFNVGDDIFEVVKRHASLLREDYFTDLE